MQELRKGKSTNHVAAKCNLQGRLKKSDPKKVPMFHGMELSSPNIKKKFIFSREKPFLMFQEIEHSRKLELSNSKIKALLIFLEM